MLADVGHAQWVFTVPKLLRPYFLRHRELLGPLSTAAWETARDLLAAAACQQKGFRPGMVAVLQTFGDQLNLYPHLHALVNRGGWTASGEWIEGRGNDLGLAGLGKGALEVRGAVATDPQ